MLLFDLNDIVLMPESVSDISSRSECEVTYNDHLPIFIAPMDTVINANNIKTYSSLGVCVTAPRGVHFSQKDNPNAFYSVSLQEMQRILETHDMSVLLEYNNFLIDIANGHMKELHDTVRRFKTEYNFKKIMVGNIANPETYKILSECGADYVRCCIGTGSACTTSVHTGVHYPMGSLISECKKYKDSYSLKCNIVADGGIKTYSDAIKCLALGADYVMIGGVMNHSYEACSPIYWKGLKLPTRIGELMYKNGSFDLYHKYRGMSTKEVQKSWGKSILKTEEGIVFYNKILFNAEDWFNEFKDYLRSSMSYCGCRNLESFKSGVIYHQITLMSQFRYKK